MKNKSKKYSYSFILLSGMMGVFFIFYFLKGSTPYISELNVIEHSAQGIGSVIPESCNAVPPRSDFLNDCTITCWNGTVYDPWNNPAACPPPPVNGVVGTLHYTCSAGTSINNVDTGSLWTWVCQGLNGGTNASGSVTKPTGTLVTTPSSCSIVTGANSCSVNVTWSTNNPEAISSITTNTPAPNTVLYTANSGGPSPVVLTGTGSKTFYLYNTGVQLASQSVTASCAFGGWDTVSSTCVNPLVNSVVVTGQYYSTPGNIALTCSGSNSYKVLKAGVLFASGAYTGPVNVPVTGSDNYSMICTQGSYDSVPTVRYYNAPPPPPPVISIVASPRTIIKNARTELSWSVQFPIASCALTAKAVCSNNICTPEQLAAETLLNNKLTSENTDTTDPNGSRSITTAVNTIIPSHINTDWKSLGKKTLQISNSMDFSIACGAVKSSTRVRVTQSNER